ncbi:hypothetical protein A1Q2_02597 [Trichosporon asahii var. asahii CBS 8904]|uniref:GST N-terminal domain-containing protein n=1 Tax=Trichosporon asahii var. asahii (strain CBS 8904) TaxID=1220162 RepID=K1W2P2_TRIAC|nr:hypothetical protein A1Q2_02597 [Trichosporon asahii var. asahii CBS 8904]
MSTPNEIVFYDIAMAPPRNKTVCSPNPWKTRLALNFKKTPYNTVWVPLPSISKVRQGLKVPACRKFMDGTDFYTLPIIEDPATGKLVGDSYDIAVYLDQQYPQSGGELFPDIQIDYKLEKDIPILVPLTDCSGSPHPQYAAFNMNVDATFTPYVGLGTLNFPFDPTTAEQTHAEFVRRASVAGITSWEQFEMKGEVRQNTLQAFEKATSGLAKLYQETPGPFLTDKPCYADFIVDGWLQCLSVILPKDEWEMLRSWHNGTFGKLFDALAPYKHVDEGTDFTFSEGA